MCKYFSQAYLLCNYLFINALQNLLFAFQKRRFCTVKAALLQRKRAAFAIPKRSFHFLRELSLQNKGVSRICPKKQK